MKKLLSLIILLGMTVSGYARTYQNVIDNVRVKLRDTGPTSDEYRYSNEDMVRAINTIEEELIVFTSPKEFRTSYSTTTVADTALYDLPSDILETIRVAYYIPSATSTFERLDYTTIEKLDKTYNNWENKNSGKPEDYYYYGNQVGLYPAPSATYSTTTWNTLKIDYLYNPTDVTTATVTNTIFDGNAKLYPYSKVLEAGVIMELTNSGIDLYYNLLTNMRNRIQRRMDYFNNEEGFMGGNNGR